MTHSTQFCHLNSDIKIVKQSNKNNHISASAIKVLLLNGFIEEATGSVFDAPLDMVWKLGEAYIKEGNKIHLNTRNNKAKILNQTTLSIPGNKMTTTMMLTNKLLEWKQGVVNIPIMDSYNIFILKYLSC